MLPRWHLTADGHSSTLFKAPQPTMWLSREIWVGPQRPDVRETVPCSGRKRKQTFVAEHARHSEWKSKFYSLDCETDGGPFDKPTVQPIGWDKESPKKGWQNGRVLIIDSFDGAPNPTANEFKNLETLQIFRTDEQPNRKKVQLTSNNGQPTSNDSQTTSNNGKTTSDNE